MAYTSKARRKTKDLREPIEGNGSKMTPNKVHKVTIRNATLSGDKVSLAFDDDFGNSHLEGVFVHDRTGEGISYIMKQLVASIAKSSEELRGWCDLLLDGMGDNILPNFIGRTCSIETEYQGKFINLKSIRSSYDRDNSGVFLQSVKADTPPTNETKPAPRRLADAGLPPIAASFF